MNGPVEVPSLDTLLADPTKAAMLPPDAARMLLARLSGLLPILIVGAVRESNKTDAPTTPDRWLCVKETASQFGVSERWLYRHKRHLPHSQPSRKVLLFPEERLRKWFAARKTG